MVLRSFLHVCTILSTLIARSWDKRKEKMTTDMDLVTAAHSSSALLGVALNYPSHVRAKAVDQMDQYDQLVQQVILTKDQNKALEIEREEMKFELTNLKSELPIVKSEEELRIRMEGERKVIDLRSENNELKTRSEYDKTSNEFPGLMNDVQTFKTSDEFRVLMDNAIDAFRASPTYFEEMIKFSSEIFVEGFEACKKLIFLLSQSCSPYQLDFKMFILL